MRLLYCIIHSIVADFGYFFCIACDVRYFISDAIEDTANHNAGKSFYIRRYSTEPSLRSVQFNCIKPNLFIWSLNFLWHGLFLVVFREISHSSVVFSWYTHSCIPENTIDSRDIPRGIIYRMRVLSARS